MQFPTKILYCLHTSILAETLFTNKLVIPILIHSIEAYEEITSLHLEFSGYTSQPKHINRTKDPSIKSFL